MRQPQRLAPKARERAISVSSGQFGQREQDARRGEQHEAGDDEDGRNDEQARLGGPAEADAGQQADEAEQPRERPSEFRVRDSLDGFERFVHDQVGLLTPSAHLSGWEAGHLSCPLDGSY